MRNIIVFLTILSGMAFCLLLGFYMGVVSTREETAVGNFSLSSVLNTEVQNTHSDKIAATDETITDENIINGEALISDTPLGSSDNSDGTESAVPKLPAQVRIEGVPLILQNPELPRGCEVTSLSMLMTFCGIETDKMILAERIKKDTTPRQIRNGGTHWGNPNNGFVGDMYNMSSPGFGVYHTPIYELLKEYEPERAHNLTGGSFADLQTALSNGMPVWVIINTSFKLLPDSSFVTWQTPDGEIQITYREHAALLIGYDEDYVYLNDPLFSSVKTEKEAFIQCWEQMGSQAVTIRPENTDTADKM